MPDLFDTYADDYDAALAEGLSASGESRDYFARERLRWLSGQVSERGLAPRTVLDFGCGVGAATPFWREFFPEAALIGVDVSARSLEVARQQHGSPEVQFQALADQTPDGSRELAFCNGVFHHIPPADRAAALAYVYNSLAPGGLFAFWENNPWNPGTRYVMHRIPFDRDAVLITPPHAHQLLTAAGFEVLRTDFLFLFPRALSALRPLEPPLSRLPLGAQYQVLCRRPEQRGR